MTTTEKKKIKITMSDRAPITVVEEDWSLVAEAEWHNGEIRLQANRIYGIKVREHDDGRRIVYGWKKEGNGGMPRGEKEAWAGFLIESGPREEVSRGEMGCKPDEAATVRAIRRVAGVIDMPELADACIADLPSQDLV